jgi:hypothetical protein
MVTVLQNDCHGVTVLQSDGDGVAEERLFYGVASRGSDQEVIITMRGKSRAVIEAGEIFENVLC